MQRSMPRIYNSFTDHINMALYDLRVPSTTANVPQAVLDGDFLAMPSVLDSFFCNHDEIDEADEETGLLRTVYEDISETFFTRRTINNMVQFNKSKILFTIVNDMDVLYILHNIDGYLREIKNLLNETEVREYVRDLIFLRENIVTLAKRVLNIHKDWKEKYIKNTNAATAIAMFSGENPDDIISAIFACPINIKALEAMDKKKNIILEKDPTINVDPLENDKSSSSNFSSYI